MVVTCFTSEMAQVLVSQREGWNQIVRMTVIRQLLWLKTM